tara:strand:+ start:804 stop:2537 length:1734 start_codon:yes stop_codon:yes gene_type:complete
MKLANIDLQNSMYQSDSGIPQTVELSQNNTISGDTFHNAFFESYWNKYSSVKEVSLTISFQGEIDLQILRRDLRTKQEELVISQSLLNQELKSRSISFKLAEKSESRIFFRIKALTETVFDNRNCCWSTSNPPQRSISLAVIMCTFNKQNYILKNLNRLLEETHNRNDVSIFVIDNASNLNLDIQRVTYVPQGNFGGAGGFTRGLIEAKKNKKITNFLFMDDDIDLDPDMIFRTIAWLAYQIDDNPIAGAMLNIKKRNSIWEQGAIFATDSEMLSPTPVTFDLSLDKKSSLDKISEQKEIDYGGWWYFSFSREHVDKAGLPLPFFIRGDDKEFGVRLKKIGHNTLPLPGIGVWHEPFTTKTSSWLLYYDLRNSLIIHMLYKWDKTVQLRIIKELTKCFISDLLVYKYNNANNTLLSIIKAMKGPDLLKEESTPTGHKEIFNSLDPFSNGSFTEETNEFQRPIKSRLATFIKFLTWNGHLLPSALMKTSVQYGNYQRFKTEILTSQPLLPAKQIIYFDRNHQKTFKYSISYLAFAKLLSLYSIVILKFLVTSPTLARRWRKSNKLLTSEEFWESYLKI